MQLIQHFTVYTVVKSLCQTLHKDIQSEPRFINMAILEVEYNY